MKLGLEIVKELIEAACLSAGADAILDLIASRSASQRQIVRWACAQIVCAGLCGTDSHIAPTGTNTSLVIPALVSAL